MNHVNGNRLSIKITFWSLIAVAILVLFEASLRIAPFFLPEPLKSFILEAERIPFSNTRTLASHFGGGTAIYLPSDETSDILVLGDSFPFGTYEKEKDIFPSRLAQKTNQKVINLGVGGQGPPEYNHMLEIGSRYHPKLVLYCLFANDFIYDPAFVSRPLSIKKPNSSLDTDRNLLVTYLNPSDYAKISMRILTNYLLSYQLYKIGKQPFAKFQSNQWWQGQNFFMFPEVAYWNRQISWDSHDVKRGLRINVSLLEQANYFTKTNLSAQFLVVLQPSKEMVYGPLTGELEAKIYHPSQYQTYLELTKQLEQKGIPVLDTTPILRERAKLGEKLYHSLDGHFNDLGHETVAKFLEASLNRISIHAGNILKK